MTERAYIFQHDWTPKGKPVASEDFVKAALIAPLALGVAACAALYAAICGGTTFQRGVRNGARWRLLMRRQRGRRSVMAALDSVILTPEPDLAERVLRLEGTPPENPGEVMRLEGMVAGEDRSRRQVVLEKLLAPQAPGLSHAVHRLSFDVVLQGDGDEPAADVQAAWRQRELPGAPRVRRISTTIDPGSADSWFEDEKAAMRTLWGGVMALRHADIARQEMGNVRNGDRLRVRPVLVVLCFAGRFIWARRYADDVWNEGR